MILIVLTRPMRMVMFFGLGLTPIFACATVKPPVPSTSVQGKMTVYRNALEFSTQRYRQESAAALSFRSVSQLQEWQSQSRTVLAKALGYRAHVPSPFDVKILAKQSFDSYERLEIEYQIEAGFRASAFVYRPTAPRKTRGAVIVWHGHSHGAKDAVAGIAPYLESKDQHRAAARRLAEQSYFVVAPELRTFGRTGNYHEHVILTGTMLMHGTTLIGTLVADSVRTVELLNRHYGFAPNQIAVTGLGLGGQVAMFHGALEQAVGVVVVQGFLSSYKGVFLKSQHDICQYVPGLAAVLDKSDIGMLIAPRAALYVNGHDDQMFPVSEANAAIAKILDAYVLYDAPSHLLLHRYAGHTGWSHDATVDWLSKHLK
jgi:dienelactone hydrolase